MGLGYVGFHDNVSVKRSQSVPSSQGPPSRCSGLSQSEASPSHAFYPSSFWIGKVRQSTSIELSMMTIQSSPLDEHNNP